MRVGRMTRGDWQNTDHPKSAGEEGHVCSVGGAAGRQL